MLVKAIAVDDQDRVKLSRKAALAERGEVDDYAKAHPASRAPPGGGGGGGGDRGGPPPRRLRRRRRRRRRRRPRRRPRLTASRGRSTAVPTSAAA